MTTTLHARPYNIDATGSYFEGMDEYQDKALNRLDSYGRHVEEYEIHFIDGDDAALFEVCGIDQSNLNVWFNDVECLQDYEKINLYYLVGYAGYTLSQGLERLDEPCITEARLKDAAAELFDECYLHTIPESVRYYIDYSSFARDCALSVDMTEFEFNNRTYTCTNASEI
jgi:hypothetical protein